MNCHKLVTYITLQKAPLDMYTQVNQSKKYTCTPVIENGLYLFNTGKKENLYVFTNII